MGLTEEKVDDLVDFTKSSVLCKLVYLGPKGTKQLSLFQSEPIFGEAVIVDATTKSVVLRMENIHPRSFGSYYRTSLITSISFVSDFVVFETLNSTYLLERTVV